MAKGRTRKQDAAGERRTVLFLGAGASAAFGYPVTSALLPPSSRR